MDARAAAKLAKLSKLASERTPEAVGRALAAAMEELGMEVAFVSEFAEQRMVFRKLAGDAKSFGWQEGESVPLDDTFCQLLIEGRLPSLIPDANADERVKHLDVTGKAGIGSYVGVPIKFSDGHIYGTLCALSHSPDPSLKERDVQFVRVLAQLVAEQLEREQRLFHQAMHDSLTGLPNRALFMNRLEQAFARAQRRESKVAVLFLDLDGFKKVNDSLGHEGGDLLLITVAERLREMLRPADTVARIGGDEFVVLLEETTSLEEVTRVAERIIDRFKEPFALQGQEVFIGTSIGICIGPLLQEGPEEILRNADAAMYHAKKRGRRPYEIFDPALHATAKKRARLEDDLRRASDLGELRVFYQPKVDLVSSKIVGLEALVRWYHPQRGLLVPDEFLPLAEKTGLMVPIGEWVLQEACREAKRLQREHPSVPSLLVEVNISAMQLERPELSQAVEQTLEESGLEPSRLTLDLTESLLVKATPSNLQCLERLRTLGVRIAIDDFGTGYWGLSYLKRFPADYLKVDKAVTRELKKDAAYTVLVKMAVELGHTLCLKVVAEGVERADQVEQLLEMGCDIGQGFYFSEPLPPGGTLKKLLNKQHLP